MVAKGERGEVPLRNVPPYLTRPDSEYHLCLCELASSAVREGKRKASNRTRLFAYEPSALLNKPLGGNGQLLKG